MTCNCSDMRRVPLTSFCYLFSPVITEKLANGTLMDIA